MSDTNNPTPVVEVTTPTTGEAAVASSAPANFRTTGSTTATDLRRELSDVLKYVESDGMKTVAITRHSKVVAAVIGGVEFKLLQRLKESAKALAPKLGVTVEDFLDSLVSAEHPVAFVEPSQLPAVVEAAAKAESVDLKEVLVPVSDTFNTSNTETPDLAPATFEN